MTLIIDVKVERKDGEIKVDYDSKNLDIKVSKTAGGNEVKVEAKSGIFNLIGKIIGKVIFKKLK